MAVELPALLADLAAETRVVQELLASLTDPDWERPTPAAGWAVRDQVSHLAYFDAAAGMSATDPDRFRGEAAELLETGHDFPDKIAARYRHLPPRALFEWFASARAQLLETFGSLDPKTRVPWYGPHMSIASSATARLMETWAHGQDIADTFGVQREPTDRLRHIAHLGVRTFGFSFQLNDREAPTAAVRVELTAPDGGRWTWGPADAENVVTGPALDFCLAVTQRRHPADTELCAAGPVASEWMSIAQAFAGAPGSGRQQGQFARQQENA